MPTPKIDDPDLPLATLMTVWPQTIAVFLAHRMLCVGCLVNPFHTLTDACLAYSLDEDMLRAALHRAVRDGSRLGQLNQTVRVADDDMFARAGDQTIPLPRA